MKRYKDDDLTVDNKEKSHNNQQLDCVFYCAKQLLYIY